MRCWVMIIEVCNDKEHNYDNGDCQVKKTKRECYKHLIGDGVCDKECNIEKYGFDKGDCN